MLGELLGVETLEQAVRGAGPRSPDSWKRAHARLVDEVSPYARDRAGRSDGRDVQALVVLERRAGSDRGGSSAMLIEGLLADFKD